ncbi:MAG: methyltransferase domain-containing protein [Planctomycetes bacterium]|nr:methyltransferase domain-containing protein [Planctomycetota bacterium]
MSSVYTAKTKYDERVATRYRNESEGRRARENAALFEILRDLEPIESLLDAPCGAGRVAALLGERGDLDYVAVDIAPSMLQRARERVSDQALVPRFLRCDLEALPFADQAFDVTLCLRLLHHLPEPIRARVVTSLARATQRVLVVTFFHPLALHYLERWVKDLFRGERSPRYSHRTRWLIDRLEPLGFTLRESRGTGFLRETRYAVFERVRPS